MRLGERAEDQIGLARAAVPGAEQQPLAADVGRAFRSVLGWHGPYRYSHAEPQRQPGIRNPSSDQRMRPALLDRLFAPVTVLPGIGATLAKLIERAAGPAVVDLLWHLPTGIIDRRAAPRSASSTRATGRTRSSPSRRGSRRTSRASAAARSGCVQRRHRHADAGLFQRARAISCAAAAGRRRAGHQRPGRVLRRHAADGASGPRRAGRQRGPDPRRSSRSIR